MILLVRLGGDTPQVCVCDTNNIHMIWVCIFAPYIGYLHTTTLLQ